MVNYFAVGENPVYTANQIIDRAIKILLEEGWVQGDYQNSKGYCAVGALRKAAYGSAYIPGEENNAAYIKAYVCADEAAGNRTTHYSIMQYNDASGRTVEEVIEVLTEAKACANG